MTKYTKIQEEVDAVQWFKDGDYNDPLYREAEEFFSQQGGIEGRWVNPGDWIVKEESGKHVILSDNEFRRTYKLSEASTDEETLLARVQLSSLEKQIVHSLEILKEITDRYENLSVLFSELKEDTDAVILSREDAELVQAALESCCYDEYVAASIVTIKEALSYPE